MPIHMTRRWFRCEIQTYRGQERQYLACHSTGLCPLPPSGAVGASFIASNGAALARTTAVGPPAVHSMPHPPTRTGFACGVGIGVGFGARCPNILPVGRHGGFKAFAIGSCRNRSAIVILTNGRNGMSIMPELMQQFMLGDRPSLSWLDYPRYDAKRQRGSEVRLPLSRSGLVQFRACVAGPGS
jgi:hypothetical protein